MTVFKRKRTTTEKLKTSFGSMYIHIHYDENGNACGGWISDPGKNPDSEISKLIKDLATALNEVLKNERSD